MIDEQLDMVVQILSHSGQIHHGIDPALPEMTGGPDTRQHE